MDQTFRRDDMEQTIYSRLEYPTKDSFLVVLEKLNHLPRTYNSNGLQISGVGIAMRSSNDRAVILLSYDEESDCYIKLGYSSIPGAIYTNLRKSNI